MAWPPLIAGLVRGLPEPWIAWLVVPTLKCMLIVALAVVAVSMLRRSSAAVRHLIWAGCLVAFVVMPLLPFVVPPVRLEVPGIAVTMERGAERSLHPLDDLEGDLRGALVDGSSATNRSSLLFSGLALGWLVGVAVLAGRVLGGIGRARRLRTSGEPASSQLTHHVENLAGHLGIRRHCPVRISPLISSAATVGLLRSTLMLPTNAETWSAESLRAVLVHELAHVRRFDCLIGLCAHCICIVHWFNPVVWLVLRQLTREQERAADDMVLTRTRIRSSEYASLLLSTLSRDPATCPTGIHGIAALHNQLSCRIRSILSPRRRRAAPGATQAMAMVLLAVGAMVLASSLTLAGVPNPGAAAGYVYAPQRVIELRPPQMIVDGATGRLLGAHSMGRDDVFTLILPEIAFFVSGEATLASSRDRLMSLGPNGYLAIESVDGTNRQRVEFAAEPDGIILVCHTINGQVQDWLTTTNQVASKAIRACAEAFLGPNRPDVQRFFPVEPAPADD